MRIILLAALMVCMQACTTTVVPAASGGSRADGVVEFAYSRRGLQRVEIDWVGVLADAVERCQAWGYVWAEPFEELRSTCESASEMGCARYRVVASYQCTTEAPF